MKKLVLAVLVCSVVLLGSNAAFALPVLQLDILGGTYDQATETIVATSDVFTLRALIDPNSNKIIQETEGVDTEGIIDLNDYFFLSAALTPQADAGKYGSFTFDNSHPISVTQDMDYGTAPVDTVAQDIPGHGIFPTYYKEFGFKFVDGDGNPLNTTSAYNTADVRGAEQNANGDIDLDEGKPGAELYYVDFVVNVGALNDAYRIHFDLYQYGVNLNNDKQIIDFAPFSHDAESGTPPVPEPGTIFLLGAGLLGLVGYARKLKK